MKFLLSLFFLTFYFSSHSQIFLVKFKDGRELYGHLYTDENIDNLQHGNTKNTETLKFREMNSEKYVDIPSRSIDHFLFIKEGQPTYKYQVLPIRIYDYKKNKLSEKEHVGFLNLLIDGDLQVYGYHFLNYLPYKKDFYKKQHSFLGMGDFFFKTKDADYVVLTKPQTYGGSWPGFSTISLFLEDCPGAKKIFDEKYPDTMATKRSFEKMYQQKGKAFEKEFAANNKGMKKKDKDLKLVNERAFMYKQLDLEFYQDVADIYSKNCGNPN